MRRRSPSLTGLTSVDAVCAFAKQKIVVPPVVVAAVAVADVLLAVAGVAAAVDTVVAAADMVVAAAAVDMTAAVEAEAVSPGVIAIVETAVIAATEEIVATVGTTEEESVTAASKLFRESILVRPLKCEAFPQGNEKS